MNMTKVTKEVLDKLNACKEGIKFFVKNDLEGFPVDRLQDIEGDYKNYVSWLLDKFDNCTYDSKGNMLSYKNSNGFSQEYTYDDKGNLLSHKDSSGHSREYTYTKDDKFLTITTDNKQTCKIPLDW